MPRASPGERDEICLKKSFVWASRCWFYLNNWSFHSIEFSTEFFLENRRQADSRQEEQERERFFQLICMNTQIVF